ncbi:MAG: hypothetical protein HKN04_09185 [Rhodothermaceae bacterium]|nr:hypothetical protein [Rhodothermaceae bacterium]
MTDPEPHWTMRLVLLSLLLSATAFALTGCSGLDTLRDEAVAAVAADSLDVDWAAVLTDTTATDSLGIGLSGVGEGGGAASGLGSGEIGGGAFGDVTLDGTSILGAWRAVEVIGRRQDTRALETGATELMLIVAPNGRATLTGKSSSQDSFTRSGRITENYLTFAGIEGAALLLLNGPRLVVREPDGRSTAFVRASD